MHGRRVYHDNLSEIGQYPRRPTQSGIVPLFVEQRPKNVEHLPKKWNRCRKWVTVPQIVEQLLLKVTCYFNMWSSVPLLIAFDIVVDRHTNYYYE